MTGKQVKKIKKTHKKHQKKDKLKNCTGKQLTKENLMKPE
jgi:hypothetical protein